MKLARICLAILATLTFASVCVAQCGPPVKAMGATESKLIANEKMITDAISKNDSAGFKNLVSMDGWVINDKGTAKVGDVFQYIFDPSTKTTSYTMEDAKVMMLNSDTGLLTYKSTWAGTVNGKAESESTYDSTLWVRRNGKWWAVFHQSTKIEKPHEAMTPATK